MRFCGYKREEILCSGIHLLTRQGQRPRYTPEHPRTRKKVPGIFSIKVESKQASNYEPLPEVVRGFRDIILGVTAGVVSPFSHNPQTISSPWYAANVEIRQRSEHLRRRMKR